MKVEVRGGRLFVEVMGPKLVPNGWAHRSRPTVVLLHGGQGFADHSVFRMPGLPYGPLGELAQLVAIDLRGHGRSDRGGPADWTMASWAADVAGVIDQLGLERPVLLGESGGGFVAMQVAQDYPDLLGGLVLASTSAHWTVERMEAAFARRGGPAAAGAAVRFWTDPGAPGASEDWQRLCLPLYAPPGGWPQALTAPEPPRASGPRDWVADAGPRGLDLEVFAQFTLEGIISFDFRESLARIDCPVLLIAGTEDPICPVEDSDDMAVVIPEQLLHYERVDGAGHTVAASDSERFLRTVERFLIGLSTRSVAEGAGYA